MPADFREFPKWMRHPSEAPAVISDDYDRGPGAPRHAAPGQPARFPPVLVNNADQQKYYESRGYEAGKGDPVAFNRAHTAPVPEGYEFREHGDQPKARDTRYPMFIGMEGHPDTIVGSEDEHKALLAERAPDKKPREAKEPPKEPSKPDAAKPETPQTGAPKIDALAVIGAADKSGPKEPDTSKMALLTGSKPDPSAEKAPDAKPSDKP